MNDAYCWKTGEYCPTNAFCDKRDCLFSLDEEDEDERRARYAEQRSRD